MCPWMTFADLDTWHAIYSQFVGADSKSAISFSVNNDSEAHHSCKVRIITAEMSHGNGPWHAWPCVTLPPGQLCMTLRYPLTPSICLQCKSTLKRAMKLAQIRQIAKSDDFIQTWPDIWRHNFVAWHLRSKFSGRVKLITKRLLKVSSWSDAYYASYSRKISPHLDVTFDLAPGLR